MFNHKLFELLKTLNENEIENFHEYIYSPYFNHSKKIAVLFDEIAKFSPSYNDKNLTKENLCKKVYKKHNYNDDAMRNDLSELLKHLEQFLLIENFKNRNNGCYFLLNDLRKRKQKDLFLKNLQSAEEELTFLKTDCSNFFYNKFLIETEKYNYSYSNEKLIKKYKLQDELDHVTLTGIYLSSFYIVEIISTYLNLQFYSDDFDLSKSLTKLYNLFSSIDLGKMIRVVNKNNPFSFVLGIYYALFKTFSNQEEENYYFRYRRLVKKYSKKLGQDELFFHYSKFIAYCLLKNKLGKDKELFDEELFLIYKEIIENEYYINYKNKYLTKDLFRNIIIHGLRVEKFNWIESILLRKSFLHPDERDDLISLGYAYLFNAKGKFNDSIEYCNKFNLNHFIYKYDIRNLTLKNYYELDYFEEAISYVDSYRHFLKNDEMLAEFRKERYKAFINYYEKIILFKEGKKTIDINKLRNNLQLENQVAYKDWLITKCNDLVNSK